MQTVLNKTIASMFVIALCNVFWAGNSQAVLVAATATFELTVHNIRVSDFIPEKNMIRRELGNSTEDYFNDFIYRVTILGDIFESDPADNPMTIINFEVAKGGFVDWTNNELNLIAAAENSPLYYKEIGENLQLQWPPQSELLCSSTTVCTPFDLFRFLDENDPGTDIDDAKRLMMNLKNTGVQQVSQVPVPATLPLLGTGLLFLAGLHRRLT